MPTTREGIVAVFCEILAPLRQGAVRHAQLAGNLRLRFLAGLEQADRFHLKFFCVRLLLFLHGSCSPLWSFLLLVYSLHKGGPWSDARGMESIGSRSPSSALSPHTHRIRGV